MIDIHAHILPEIDDGSQSLDETIEILEKLAEQGITDIIATPHVMTGTYDNDKNSIENKMRLVKKTIKDNGINISVYPGAELYLDPDILEYTKINKLTLGYSHYVLVESAFQGFPQNFEKIIFNFQQSGYKPIIAHAERYQDFKTDFNYLISILNRGCFVQVNCGSLFGAHGDTARKLALKMLDEGCVHFLASDLHGIDGRPIVLKETYKFITKNYSKELAELLMVKNPRHVLYDATIENMISNTYWDEESSKPDIWEKIRNLFK